MVAAVGVILSGRIEGDAAYRLKFAVARVEARRRWHGVEVWNPAELPDGREYGWCMDRCLEVIRYPANRGAKVVRMDDWMESKGARAEVAVAEAYGLELVDQWWKR